MKKSSIGMRAELTRDQQIEAKHVQLSQTLKKKIARNW
jgi:hypothetical protein